MQCSTALVSGLLNGYFLLESLTNLVNNLHAHLPIFHVYNVEDIIEKTKLELIICIIGGFQRWWKIDLDQPSATKLIKQSIKTRCRVYFATLQIYMKKT